MKKTPLFVAPWFIKMCLIALFLFCFCFSLFSLTSLVILYFFTASQVSHHTSTVEVFSDPSPDSSEKKCEERAMEFNEQATTTAEFNTNDVVLISENIDIMSTLAMVKDDTAGAISTFMGTTRNNFEGIVTLLCFQGGINSKTPHLRNVAFYIYFFSTNCLTFI